ncbi:MAG TPA: hypothetical protein VE979_05750 [Streptosporangiaceae bacterium]|nr:hypothetical protein [Streptosporangiaceae bacterium]
MNRRSVRFGPVSSRSVAAQIWHSGGVESRVDLDQVAGLISRYAIEWEKAGCVAGPVTWKDVRGPGLYPFREDRRKAAEADSVGVAVRKGEQEGRLVVFRGGWADLEYWSGRPCDEPVLEVPGWDDRMNLADIERLLRRFAGLFG